MPALLTRIEIAPNSLPMDSISASTAPASVTLSVRPWPPWAASRSPIAAALVALFFGAVAGLMLGGLVSLRPDHDRYIQATRDAMAAGHTTVVVHAFSAEQRDKATELLRSIGGETTSTL